MPKKILIAEDEKEILFGLSTLLKAQGYLTIGAVDAFYAISLAHKEKPDLIILDLGLPAGGGFHVLENINNSTETNAIQVLVLTGKQSVEAEEKARKLGVAGYFHKPFEPEKLLAKIKEVLENDGR